MMNQVPITGEIKKPPPNFAHENAMAKAIITALGEFLDKRTQDLPHRFKAPAAFGEYLTNYGVNTTYIQQMQLPSANSHYPMMLEMTLRPTQHILEIIFTGADGTRLFTLEIEYDAVQKERKVLLSWRTKVHSKANHRHPPRKGPEAKAS